MASQNHRAPARFVGRTEELRALALGVAERPSLTTVCGPGGIGKSRLVAELCASSDVPAAWVDLSERSGATAVLDALASTLGLELDDLEPLERLVRRFEQTGTSVVVLDNAEHLVPQVRAVCEALVARLPVCVVVTSRLRLHAERERVVELGPLGADDAQALFLDHLRRGRAGPPDIRAEALTRVLSVLEGVPLALELAAHRVMLVGVEGALARLHHPGELLRGGPPEAPLRHRAMAAALEGTWASLDASARRLAMACAHFRGDFTVEHALELAEPLEGGLDAFGSLVEHALVASATPERFRMLMPIREDVRSRTSSAQTAALAEAHAALFARLSLGVAPSRVSRDVAELEAAVDTLTVGLDARRAELALAVLGALTESRLRSGRAQALRHTLELVAPHVHSARERALLHEMAARIENHAERHAAAEEHERTALELATEVGDEVRASRVLTFRSGRLSRLGELERAQAAAAEARARMPRTERSARTVIPLASCLYQQLESKAALALLDDALASTTEPAERALLHAERGVAALDQLRVDEARAALSAADVVFRQLGWRIDSARVRLVGALAWLHEGELEKAEQGLLEARRTLGTTPEARVDGYIEGYLGVTAACRGDFATAAWRWGRACPPDRGHASLFDTYRAGALALGGAREHAHATLAAAFRAPAGPWVACAREPASWVLEVADAAASDAASEVADRLRSVEGRLSRAPVNLEWALAARVVRAAIGDVRARRFRRRLRFDVERRRIEFEGREVDCRRYGNAWRAATALVTAHRARARDLSPESLAQSVWARAPLVEGSARNRVRVTIAQLRKLGLRDAIVTTPNGYALAPDVLVDEVLVDGRLPEPG